MIFRKRPEPPKAVAQEPLTPGTKVAPEVLAAARLTLEEGRAFAPHCDARILHEPGQCWACDLYPDWQKLRELWDIAFTGHKPQDTGLHGLHRQQLPCPADYNRPPDSTSDHRQWGGNVAWKDRGK
jgi:hypothetical protein